MNGSGNWHDSECVEVLSIPRDKEGGTARCIRRLFADVSWKAQAGMARDGCSLLRCFVKSIFILNLSLLSSEFGAPGFIHKAGLIAAASPVGPVERR